MKKLYFLTLVAGMVGLFAISANAFDLVNKLGVGVTGGIFIPTNGNVTTDSTVADFFDAGPSWGIRLTYGIVKGLSAETGFNYSYIKIKDEVNEDPVNEPYLNMPEFYLDGVWELNGLFHNSNNIWNPFLKAGVSLYPWKLTEDGIDGVAQTGETGETFSKTSFGLNFGAGLEVFASSQLSIFTESKYHYIYTQDEEKLGADFDNTGYLDIVGGINYYFPL